MSPSQDSEFRLALGQPAGYGRHGDRLICVRNRYDAERKKRLKTVELLVSERDCEPPRPPFAKDRIVAVHVPFGKVTVRGQVKQAGGKWNPDRKVWEMRYDRAVALGLAARIVDDPASTGRCPKRGSSIYLRMPSRYLDEDAGIYR